LQHILTQPPLLFHFHLDKMAQPTRFVFAHHLEIRATSNSMPIIEMQKDLNWKQIEPVIAEERKGFGEAAQCFAT